MNRLEAYYESLVVVGNKNLTPMRDDVDTRLMSSNIQQVAVGYATLKPTPDDSAEPLNQLLYGEEFAIYEEKNGWAWGQSQHDFYVGYVPMNALAPTSLAATHRVKNLTTNLYIEPNGKSQIERGIPFNSLVAVEGFCENVRFAKTALGWLPIEHIIPITESQNYVEVAEMFLGCPYLWGGRNLLGIDCSGLLQAALNAASLKAPRDTGMQFDALGAKPIASGQVYGRGDIIFFPGHVGIMADETNLIHANAYHMNTVVEPLADVIDRLKGDHDMPVTGVVTASIIAAL